ncbi:MAG: oxygenase MpaB family protein [Acidimicrobiales bacterium]
MPPARAADPSRTMVNGASLALAGANVVMQLSRRPVGRAVAESTVHSGSLVRHPLKRTRTTLSYVMLALYGTDEERRELRRQVNAQHRAVRPAPGAPVTYRATDPELQLWVAACMYYGVRDALALLYGPARTEFADEVYRQCARFATTLQVPIAAWPRDRDAFEEYWRDALTRLDVDDVTARYLIDLIDLRFLPGPLARVAGPAHRFLTTGFLPPTFRDLLDLEWDAVRQRRFERVVRAGAAVAVRLPRPVREFPWNWCLYDARRRLRRGRALV